MKLQGVPIKRLMTSKVALQLSVECKAHGFSSARAARYAGPSVCEYIGTRRHAHMQTQAARFLSMSTGQVTLVELRCSSRVEEGIFMVFLNMGSINVKYYEVRISLSSN